MTKQANLKLGKLPARPGSIKFRLATYLTTLPIPPTKFGHQNLETDWQMLGNDKYGDCVWAGAAHETMLWNKEAAKDVIFNTSEVLSDYADVTGFNPNDPTTDQGTDMQVAASYRRKIGVIGNGQRHQILAYLAITPGNATELKKAIYLFSAVGIGIKFPRSAMSQFNNGKNWTIVRNSPIIGGHYVPAVGYDSRYLYVVTWGKLQKMSWGFFHKYNDESVVYLSQEFLTNNKSLESFDIAELQNDLRALNG